MISRRALILSGAGLFITKSALSKSDERSYVLGSTLLEDIVSDLTTGRAKTRLLISGSACPGTPMSKLPIWCLLPMHKEFMFTRGK